MMTHAYNLIYLSRAARVLGNMVHYAVRELNYDGDDFMHLFIQSDIAEQIEIGNPKYIAGMSGAELFSEVMEHTMDYQVGDIIIETYERSDAYWVGWALTHYQWYSGRCFKDILETVSFDDLMGLYGTLHEADIQKVYDVLDEHFRGKESKLKATRRKCGITQEELSKLSGVSLNTIRAYERKSKDINKGQADIILRLVQALKCNINDVLE